MKIVRYEDLENFLITLERYSDGKAQTTGKPIAWTTGRLKQMISRIPTFEIAESELDGIIKDSHSQYRFSGKINQSNNKP